jgi:signal transduction histidine kinase/AraC-like DNA-binding protein/ligand-binding sensor domain-containing protein
MKNKQFITLGESRPDLGLSRSWIRSMKNKHQCLNFMSIIICLWMISTDCFPQHLVVKQIANNDGLSNNSVNCFLEDSEHLLWIGTWDGLNVYNGRNFKTYRHNKNDNYSISNNIIRQIAEENDTCLWVVTDYCLNRLNKNKQQFVRFFSGDVHPLLAVTSRHTVVIYERGKGLLYFDNKRHNFFPLKTNFQHRIRKIFIDSSDYIYLWTEQMEILKSRIIHTGKEPSIEDFHKIEQQTPVSDIFLSGDVLFLCCGNFLKIIDNRHLFPEGIDLGAGNTATQLVCDGKQLFICLNKSNCAEYNPKTGKIQHIKDIPENIPVFSLYIDKSQDILWIGTDGQGVLSSYKHQFPFKTAKTGNPVRSFCKMDKDIILVGTKGEGIKLLDKRTDKIISSLTEHNGLISNSVYAIRKNRSGDIFIGTEGAGINILSRDGDKLERLNIPPGFPPFSHVYSIIFTHNDSLLWLGTSGYGLIRINLQKQYGKYLVSNVKSYMSSNHKSSLNNNRIYPMIKGSNENELWIGTRGGGLHKLDIAKETFELFEDIYPDLSLAGNDILSLQKDAANNLWVGTSYGLSRLLLSGNPPSMTEYADNEGLKNNTIHGVIADKNDNIWISTNHGISLINTQTGYITGYTSRDGLKNNEFADGAYYMDNEGTLYFGVVNGFSYFNPDKIQLRNYKPVISLSNLKIYNNNQNIHDRIENNTLKPAYDEPYITFTFAVHDFINNENCEFRYRLLNFSDKWIDNGNNPDIVITKLPPGKHQLEVECSNGDRIWNNNIYTLNLDVAYPWWLSIGAFIVYFVLAGIMIYIVLSVVRNRIKLNRQLLLEQIEKEHQQKTHESKLRFFTNVAHEFFTPLTLIYGPAQHLLEKVDLDSYTKRYIQIIKNNADRMQKLINELMEFRKAESGHTLLHAEQVDVKLLIEYISDNYTEIAKENKIDFQLETSHVSTFVTDRNSLEKILFNLISNAFKYTPSNGYIHIHACQEEHPEGSLHFRIRNSGNGLTEKQMFEIFSRFKIFETSKQKNTASTGIGLNLTKSLTEILGGNITVNSILNEYVEFTLVINPMQLQTRSQQPAENTGWVVNKQELTGMHKDISILIVEDEKNIRELLKDILIPYYNVREAADGEQGLKEVNHNMPDIIISDILMPNLDGIGLIDRLKSNEKTAHIPVISISAKNSIEDHITAYSHGADLYIPKPFHPRHVLSTVENIINKHSLLKKYFNSSWSAVTVKNGKTMYQEDEHLLQEIVLFIERNIDDESLNFNSIADFIGISKANLYRKLKELTDKTPSEFVKAIRLEYASKLLKTTNLTVSEIIFKSGFANKSYFYREFAQQFGISPLEYRNEESKKIGDKT